MHFIKNKQKHMKINTFAHNVNPVLFFKTLKYKVCGPNEAIEFSLLSLQGLMDARMYQARHWCQWLVCSW